MPHALFFALPCAIAAAQLATSAAFFCAALTHPPTLCLPAQIIKPILPPTHASVRPPAKRRGPQPLPTLPSLALPALHPRPPPLSLTLTFAMGARPGAPLPQSHYDFLCCAGQRQPPRFLMITQNDSRGSGHMRVRRARCMLTVRGRARLRALSDAFRKMAERQRLHSVPEDSAVELPVPANQPGQTASRRVRRRNKR